MHPAHRPAQAAGFSILEVIIALLVVAALVPFVTSAIFKRQQDVKEQAAAQQLTAFAKGASYYLRENFNSLYAAAGSGTVAVPAATIVAAGNLPSSFQIANGYRQTHCMLVRRSPSATPTRNLIEAFAVTEGGSDIEPTRLPFVAAMAGGPGGAIELVSGAATIRGAYGGYALPAGPYAAANCSGTAITPGRLAYALFFDNQHLIADYLYRYQVPGYPEANTMHANIDMSGNNIVNANEVQATALVDRNNSSFRVEPAGNSLINNLTANSITARIYCDRDNPTYCVDPASTSRILDIYVDARSSTVRLSSLLPNFVDKGAVALFNNALLVKPNCPDGGTPELRLAPAVFQPDTGMLSNVFYQDTGAAWRMRLTSTGGVDMPPGTQVIATYGCRYL
mgnify:CR=1 FL=1